MRHRDVSFHPGAERDVDAALRWYLDRNPLAAREFLRQVETVVSAIAESPSRWPAYRAGCRRCVLLRFPFSVIYRRHDDAIEVLAIAHAKRKAGYWLPRVS